MTCQGCGHNFCWLCCRSNHSSEDLYCKTIALLSSEKWGQNTATRTITKTLAMPTLVAGGGVALGAAGLAAGVAVGLVVSTSPLLAGYGLYKKYRISLAAKEAASQWQVYRTSEIFLRGIIVVIPPKQRDYFSTVNLLLSRIPSITVPSDGQSNSHYQVAYVRNYVLYFTATPSAVPGFEREDYPFCAAKEGCITTDTNAEHSRDNEIHHVVTERRTYVALPPAFFSNLRDLASVEENATAFLQELETIFQLTKAQ